MEKKEKKTPPPKKSFIEHAEFALKLFGASAALTAIMGFPAVSLHFSEFGIPSELVTTDIAVRAGVQPALSFIILFGYLWYVRTNCVKSLSSSTKRAYFTPLLLVQVVPLAAVAMLVHIGGVYCGVFLVVWWLLGALANVGDPAGPVFWTLIVLSLPAAIGLYITTLSWVRKLTQPDFTDEVTDDEVTEPHWAIMLYSGFIDYIEFLKNFVALYLVTLFIELVAPGMAHWFTLSALLVAAAFLALASGLVAIGLATLKGMPELGLGNLRASMGFATFAALLTVLLYSVDVYPALSKSLGGGQPDVVSMWVDRSEVPALGDWPAVETDDNHYHLVSAYLLRLDGEVAIIVDRLKPPARWIVIPRGAVTSIANS